ncbi:M23 family metallopeptidase [Natronosporangium hydrolyticum]|uniref:M23 family metallopeptidase n=1 Tax=Natronosporangium hydrolyticum TaxID=2811111 RepID=UPI001EFA20A5|nr:M23 family metallopeptidase [Natronosporangium hydrolyticum]
MAITGLLAAGGVTAAASRAAGASPPAPAASSADAATAARGEYRWPLPGPPPVTRQFIPPAAPWLAGHRGVDLAAPPGAVVFAAGAGVVFFAGPVAGRPVVSVAHPDGLRTTYEPVVATVAVGEPVAAGAPIGVLEAGHPGCSTSACLHWGVRQGEVYLDPLSLLGWGRVRLLPRPAVT